MKHPGQYLGAMVVAAALVLPGIVTSAASGQEKVGQVQQPLVNGQPVGAWWQEHLGLLTLSTGCSATLLTNDWAITAAHCLSPANVANPSSVTVTANWKTMQQRRAAQIVMFGNPPSWDPWDIALVRVDFRFVVGVDDESFYQNVWIDGPYTPNLLDARVGVFGRGIYRFASGAGPSATPSQRDGQYRYGTALIRWADGRRYWYVGDNGLMVAGGDSGGASFVDAQAGRTDDSAAGYSMGGRPSLVGVHSLCKTQCLPGQTCARNDWTWIMATPECGDAPIQPIWNQIRQTILATRSPSLPTPPLGPINPLGDFASAPPCNPVVFVPAPDAPAAGITGVWGDRGIVEQDRINVRIVESPRGSATFDVVVREGSPPNAIEVTGQQVRVLARPTSQYGGPRYALAPATVPDPRKADAGKLSERIVARPVPPRAPGGSPGDVGPGRTVTSAGVLREGKLFATRFDRSLGLDLGKGIRLEVDILCSEQLSPRVYQVRYLRFLASGEKVVDVMLRPSQPLPR
jgi:hypothetical protein